MVGGILRVLFWQKVSFFVNITCCINNVALLDTVIPFIFDFMIEALLNILVGWDVFDLQHAITSKYESEKRKSFLHISNNSANFKEKFCLSEFLLKVSQFVNFFIYFDYRLLLCQLVYYDVVKLKLLKKLPQNS